jgi:hypothetical protein
MPDRIRSGLLTEEMIASRSKVRGVSEQDYMRGNLLGREVAAENVAQAFLAQALALKTTADVTTVDGGNIAPRCGEGRSCYDVAPSRREISALLWSHAPATNHARQSI